MESKGRSHYSSSNIFNPLCEVISIRRKRFFKQLLCSNSWRSRALTVEETWRSPSDLLHLLCLMTFILMRLGAAVSFLDTAKLVGPQFCVRNWCVYSEARRFPLEKFTSLPFTPPSTPASELFLSHLTIFISEWLESMALYCLSLLTLNGTHAQQQTNWGLACSLATLLPLASRICFFQVLREVLQWPECSWGALVAFF